MNRREMFRTIIGTTAAVSLPLPKPDFASGGGPLADMIRYTYRIRVGEIGPQLILPIARGKVGDK